MQQELENIDVAAINCDTGTGSTEPKTLPLQSPSEWSYDAVTRSLNNPNTNSKNTSSFYKNTLHGSSNSIISLLNEMEFSPLESRMNDLSQSNNSLSSDVDISSAMRPLSGEEDNEHKDNDNNKARDDRNVDPVNRTQMTAGLLLLFISGILDAGAIAYVNWLYGVGFTMKEIFMFQGIVEVILCFAFGIITLKLMVQSSVWATRSANQLNQLQTMRMRPPPNISFRSLVLPFSMEYNATFVPNVFRNGPNNIALTNTTLQQYNSNRYGAISDGNATPQQIAVPQNKMNCTQLLAAMLAFGVVSSASHLTYFIGYLNGLGLTRDHYEIAPLFNSLAVGFAFLWSYVVYKTRLHPETLLYLFLMYIGMIICGYSFIKHVHGLILNMSNVYLILSAFLDSLGYILIKYASSMPTFVLVFSQSVFCAISGLILFETAPHDIIQSALNERSFSNVIQVSSVGLIGFGSTWCFIRGTQLISIGTASFIKMTFFVLFSIVIQVFSIDGKTPHFYCIFGLCLISLSILLMLIEKFTKFRSS